MRVLYKLSVIVLTIVAFTSCEKEVNNIKYPEFKFKWDIVGYLSPDNQINTILIGQNLRNYGKELQFDDIGHTSITLSNGTNIKDLESIRYTRGDLKNSDYRIEEGKTYIIKIVNDKGYNAEASCTVPFRGNFNLKVDTTVQRFLLQDYGVGCYVKPSIQFDDPVGVENFYMIFCERISYRSKYSTDIRAISSSEKAYFNDKGRDGMRFKLSFDAFYSGSEDSSFLKFYLLNTDKAYFDYKTSFEKYNNGEDPFTEPSPVYSNIKGGLGIFAAYTVDSVILRVK